MIWTGKQSFWVTSNAYMNVLYTNGDTYRQTSLYVPKSAMQTNLWTKSHGYSHSLYCCSWLNSAGLRHTQLLSPMLPEARGWALGVSPRVLQWELMAILRSRCVKRLRRRGFGMSSLLLYENHRWASWKNWGHMNSGGGKTMFIFPSLDI